MPRKKSPKCTVQFVESKNGSAVVSAGMFDRAGHSINVINYPRGYQMTSAERTRARARLLRGCAELSRPRSRR